MRCQHVSFCAQQKQRETRHFSGRLVISSDGAGRRIASKIAFEGCAKHEVDYPSSHILVPPRLDKRSTVLTAGALVVLCTFHATPLQAQTGEQRSQARALAGQGYDALQRKNFVKAEELFRRADALVHAPTLVLDHARALVGLGRLVEAHEGFAQVLREGVAPNAPWQWRTAVDTAKAELAVVEPRLAWLTVTVRGPQAPEVQIDSKLLRQAALGVPLATDPGSHIVTVRADRFLPTQKAITLSEGQSAKLELLLEQDPAAPPLPLPVAKEAPKVIILERAQPPKGKDNTLATILLTAGGVGIATGAVTGFLALGVRSDLKQSCSGGICAPGEDAEYAELSAKRDRYRALGTASGVAFAVGLGATVTGLALLVVNSRPRTATSATHQPPWPRLRFQAGVGSVSVSGTF